MDNKEFGETVAKELIEVFAKHWNKLQNKKLQAEAENKRLKKELDFLNVEYTNSNEPMTPKAQELKARGEMLAENKQLREIMHVEKDGKCHVCNKMTDSLAGNPTKWGHFFAHMDGQT